MARSTPSLLALLGIAALAGYQNREKLGQMLGRQQGATVGGQGAGGGLSDLLSGLGGGSGRGFGDIGDRLGTGAAGGGIAAGLRDLVDSFTSGGRRDLADSWVASGPNRPPTPDDLESGLDPELLAELSERTGLDRAELLRRLSVGLPDTVDALTPDGRLPA